MNGVVVQVAALSILYVVARITTRGVLYSQPVSHAGYSNVHPRHSGRRFDGVSCLLLLLFMTVTVTTDTHSVCIILLAFPQQPR
jgi:hypothetical protein